MGNSVLVELGLPSHPYLTDDGYEIRLPGGKTATAYRTLLRGYAMTLRAYFDGSGKENANSDVLTLAGLAAPLAAWDWLESKWAAVCWKHNVCGSHMREAMHFQGDFSPDRGWNEQRLSVFLKDLEDVLFGFGNLPEVFFSVVVIDMVGYRKALRERPVVTIAGVPKKFPLGGHPKPANEGRLKTGQ